MIKDTVSLSEARNIALGAQGFTQRRRQHNVAWDAMAAMVDRLHLLQIDSVNVLVRSHYLPLYTRLGSYDRAVLDARSLACENRHFFECWAHEASLVPLPLHPLLRWRMQRAQAGKGIYKSFSRFAQSERSYLRKVLTFVTKHGPTRASEVPGGGPSGGGWWGWSKGKLALETLFDQGLIAVAGRRGFERLYDLPERIIPREILNEPTPHEEDALASLIEKSAAALGVATEAELRDYFRLPVNEGRKAIGHAVEAGVLLPVALEGCKMHVYMHCKSSVSRKVGGTALLSPFDPLVWNRDRAERLFQFRYRIEIYTPEAKRKYGYYVLPFLHGENLVGRVCLKADRASGTLLVNRAHVEPGVDAAQTAEALAEELTRMTQWLGLESVSVGKVGNLAKKLALASK